MARQVLVFLKHPFECCTRPSGRGTAFEILLAILSVPFGAISAASQTPTQQYVFAVVPVTTTSSQIVGFSKDGANGALTAVPGTPLADRFEGGALAIDGLGRFLFILNPVSNHISMYQIDQSSGAIVEAPGSPFAVDAAQTSDGSFLAPICLATEPSGQYLYVGYGSRTETQGALLQFTIDASNPSNPQLDSPSAAGGAVILQSAPVALAADGKGLHLYAGLSGDHLPDGFSQTNVYAIDPATGELSGPGTAGQINGYERSIAIGGRGRVFFDGSGVTIGALESALISPGDGTANSVASTVDLGVGNVPVALLADSSGSFLYVQLPTTVAAYSIDPISGALNLASATTGTLTFRNASASVDPEGPYIYASQGDGIHGFQVDPVLGSLSEVLGSPFPLATTGQGFVAISGLPAQAVSGPFAAVFPAAQDFGGVNVGQSSNPQTITITNTGDQLLTLNNVVIGGADAGDFKATTSTCSIPMSLFPNSNTNGTCSVGMVFTPTAAGPRQASLAFSDNGPGSPQTVALSGTGVAQTPALTFAPASLVFPATNQGSASATMSITLTSSGAVTLHTSGVALSGANPGDFSFAPPKCPPASFSPNSSCTLSVTFAPNGPDQRSASIVINDDAPGGSQSIQLTGTGVGPAVTKPVLQIAPASVFFGAVTQGTVSASQSVTLVSAGTAALHLTSVITVAGANASEFTIGSNTCAVAAYPVNATCALTLRFAPLGAGQRIATLQIADDASGSLQTVALTGQSNPALTIGPPPSGGFSATVTPGQTATYNLLLAGGLGFSGSVAFGCTGVPAKASCNAPTTQITGGNTSTVVVSIATTANSLLPLPASRPETFRMATRTFILTLWMAVCWLILGRNWLRKFSGPIVARVCVSLALAVVLFYAAGCAGAAGPVAQTVPVIPSAGTPQGTFTITLTPTVTTAGHQQLAAMPPIPLTLIVN
jgi:hypothetical protein